MMGRITSFRDLEVYQNTYKACIEVMMKVIPKLPDFEKNDLKSQLRRSVKAIPRLIAEGYAKRHQKHGFQKYLDDAMGECNETIVSLEQCGDLYGETIDKKLCEQLIDLYDKSGRQLYNLSTAWTKFKRRDT
jgi:four helix bundle protein